MLVTVIIIAILMYPAWYGVQSYTKKRRKKRSEKILSERYEQQLLKHKLSVEFEDRIGKRILALDRKNKKLLLVDGNSQEGGQDICLPLLSVVDTRIIYRKKDDGRIARVLLELKKKRYNDLMQICFFDERTDRVKDLPAFSRRAFFWKNRIDVNKYQGGVYPGNEFVL